MERAEAGRMLGKLDDPRREALEADAMLFSYVPAGKFCMGSDRKSDPEAYDDEEPQQKLDLPAFWISQYPVTSLNTLSLLRAGGYNRAEFWVEAGGGDNRRDEGRVIREVYDGNQWVKEIASQPYGYGEPFNLPNHPVVGVTWYEALAFTPWA